ncbi:MAG: LacI family DNA-binding transcriptional regulator [Propionibacteriaceae bacterium]|nr:LacI family DNA-binding transcriptional regulator [Propionibacteriaceae bacterium]
MLGVEPSTMQDVAARAGVSISTVSRALRQSTLVSAQTRQRVLAAADELSFAVSRAASSLASGKLGRIGVLVSGHLGAWFNGSILDGIYGHLRDERLELLIYRVTDSTEREQFFATLPARRNADALIVASFALTAVEQERLNDLSMPLVYLNQRVPSAPSVSIDDVAGARMGARHLLNLGHRRIAFVKSSNQAGFLYSAAQRIDGYRAELDAAGISEAQQVTLIAGSDTDGEEVVAQFLSQPDLPTALMVESDELAMSIMSACSRIGLRVPEEVSVLGFDDHALAVTFGLSTIAQPVERLGREAASLAVTLAAAPALGRSELSSTELTLATALRLRHSTARPRVSDRLSPPHQLAAG